MSIRKKLHHLISGQLPDFVRAEYPDFVTFLEHYYTWMEKSGQSHYYLLNSDDWMDIDATLDVFIPEFRKQFANEFSDQIELSTRKLVKYINQYYESKGSENSTEMFFRFMFNDTASVTYPGDYILRASDGRWRRKKFIKVNNTNFSSNNIYALNASIITLRYLEFIPGAGNIERTVTTRCYDVFRTRPNIYQLEVDLDPNYEWPDYISLDSDLTSSLGNHDTHVYVEKAGVTYGSITKQLVSVSSVGEEGSNFVKDDSYFISETGVEGLYFAGDYTEILTGADAYVYDLIQNNAIIRVTKTEKRASATYFAEDYVLTGDYAEATTVGLLKRLAIIDTGEKFAFRDDSGEPVKTFTIEFEPRITGSSATVTFNTGLVYHAPGEFKNNEGFLSSNIHLQDYDYYQPYSYVVSSSKQRNSWETTFIESTHPAGFKMFAELNLEGEISVTPSVTSSITEVEYLVFLDSETVTVSESDAKSLTRPFSEAIPVSENVVKTFNLSPSESVTVTDLGTSYTFDQQDDLTSDLQEDIAVSESDAKSLTKPISDSATVTELLETTITFLRDFTESITSSDVVDSISTSLEKSESVSVSESDSYSLDKSISETIPVSENVAKQFNQENDISSDLQEDITVSENIVKLFSRPASDSVTVTDAGTSYTFDQQDDLTSDLQEDIAVSESSVFALDKSLTEVVTSSESDAKSFSIPISDNSSVSDSPVKSINVPFTETVTSSEAVDSLNITKNITETIPVSENVQKHFYQENDISSDLQEDISVTDSPVKSINVPFTESVTTSENVSTLVVIPVNISDTVTVTDAGTSYTFDQQDDVTSDLQDDVSVTDSPAISFSRSVSDAASTSENSVINTNKSISDSATATDAGGEIFNNSYSPEYFAEQYVGTTYIF